MNSLLSRAVSINLNFKSRPPFAAVVPKHNCTSKVCSSVFGSVLVQDVRPKRFEVQ